MILRIRGFAHASSSLQTRGNQINSQTTKFVLPGSKRKRISRAGLVFAQKPARYKQFILYKTFLKINCHLNLSLSTSRPLSFARPDPSFGRDRRQRAYNTYRRHEKLLQVTRCPLRNHFHPKANNFFSRQ